MASSPSINRIHVNNSTGLSLNERFTAMQSFAPPVVQTKPKPRSRPATRFNNLNGTGSAANKKFLQQLEKKHKMEAALKLKRRSLKAGLMQRGGRGRNINALALRLAPNGKVIKARSLANVATMKADLVQPIAHLHRSNSGNNIGARVGLPRRINRRRTSQIGISPQGGRRMRIRQNNVMNNGAVPNQFRGRSRSRSRTRQRSNSVSNIGRRNNPMIPVQLQQQQLQQRSRSRSRSRGRLNTNQMNRNNRAASQSRSVHSRLGIKRLAVNTNSKIRGLNKRRGIGRVSRGRIDKRRNSTNSAAISNAANSNQNILKRQGRSRSRSQVRNGLTVQGQRGGRSRSRARSRSTKRGGKTQVRGVTANRRGRSRSRGRGGRGPTRGGNNNTPKRGAPKKEDLDKELDQYMASSNNEND